jgi:hypothetical protein
MLSAPGEPFSIANDVTRSVMMQQTTETVWQMFRRDERVWSPGNSSLYPRLPEKLNPRSLDATLAQRQEAQ